MEKVDLKKRYPPLFSTGKRDLEPHIVDVPPLQYLMIDGAGDPNGSQRFQEATTALYAASYGVKFASKGIGKDFTVMVLEGLWWSDDPNVFALDERDAWQWTLMIMQPDWITEEVVGRAVDVAARKGKVERLVADDLRLETLEEGQSGQILHIGPYAEEPPTIRKLHDFIEEKGYQLDGKHHEIYMSDPRRIDPAKMKTIIRHPVVPV